MITSPLHKRFPDRKKRGRDTKYWRKMKRERERRREGRVTYIYEYIYISLHCVLVHQAHEGDPPSTTRQHWGGGRCVLRIRCHLGEEGGTHTRYLSSSSLLMYYLSYSLSLSSLSLLVYSFSLSHSLVCSIHLTRPQRTSHWRTVSRVVDAWRRPRVFWSKHKGWMSLKRARVPHLMWLSLSHRKWERHSLCGTASRWWKRWRRWRTSSRRISVRTW